AHGYGPFPALEVGTGDNQSGLGCPPIVAAFEMGRIRALVCVLEGSVVTCSMRNLAQDLQVFGLERLGGVGHDEALERFVPVGANVRLAARLEVLAHTVLVGCEPNPGSLSTCGGSRWRLLRRPSQ